MLVQFTVNWANARNGRHWEQKGRRTSHRAGVFKRYVRGCVISTHQKILDSIKDRSAIKYVALFCANHGERIWTPQYILPFFLFVEPDGLRSLSPFPYPSLCQPDTYVPIVIRFWSGTLPWSVRPAGCKYKCPTKRKQSSWMMPVSVHLNSEMYRVFESRKG